MRRGESPQEEEEEGSRLEGKGWGFSRGGIDRRLGIGAEGVGVSEPGVALPISEGVLGAR